jgi:aspartate racemase
MERALSNSRRRLLLCTRGTRDLQVFERHAQWQQVQCDVVWPNECDQIRLHNSIYEIKRNRGIATAIEFIDHLLDAYSVDSLIVGCTELHICVKELRKRKRQIPECVDPLDIVAQSLARR